MAQDVSRLEIAESAYTYTETRLSLVLKEIDARLNCNEIYDTITYISGLISKVEIFSNLVRTIKVCERTFTRTLGTDGVDYISAMVTIFYNSDSSEDSRITTTITRNANNQITECDNVFSTSESQPCNL